ncbi:hypothetical protein ACFL1G_01345 [Planctomycetota bacterium]
MKEEGSCFANQRAVRIKLAAFFAGTGFYLSISRLNGVFFQEPMFDGTKEELITIVGQRPTDVSYSKNSNGEPNTVVIYKYHFPPFNNYFEFTFINDNLTKQMTGDK